jgi:uncharacterized damage-inducible protein DinB
MVILSPEIAFDSYVKLNSKEFPGEFPLILRRIRNGLTRLLLPVHTFAKGGAMTVDIGILLAKYNAQANARMNKVLTTLSGEEWKREMGGFYKSVHALCAHLFIADSNWLNRFKSLREFPSLQAPALAKAYAWGEMPFDTFSEYEEKRKQLDSLFLSFANELTDGDLGKRLRYQNWKGVQQDRAFGGLILHVFNHQTHHRGMISLYLDILGRENDFSNLVELV